MVEKRKMASYSLPFKTSRKNTKKLIFTSVNNQLTHLLSAFYAFPNSYSNHQ